MLNRTHLLASIALIALPTTAFAQEAPQADDAAPASDEIIVTGTAGGGVNRQAAAFAITNITSDAIDKAAPNSTADLFKVIPGVSAESSGGQNGANIFVRGYPSGGDAEFVTLTVQGVPFFSPPTLSFLENTQLIRIDETIDRVEAVRGGTGALFGNGQPGLTVNFVQKEGGRDFEGLVKGSITDYGDIRGDMLLSGPLGENTSFMVGGYYSSGHGIRNPGFTAEKGGQITGNIRHDFDKGSLLVYARYLNDHGQWLLPIPVIRDGNKVRQFGNIDPGTGALAGPETRLSVLPDGTRTDLADGRGAKLINLGTNFDYEIGDGLQLRYRASYLNGDADTTGLVPASTAMTANAYAASLGSSVGSLTYVNGGQAVSGTQQVIRAGTWIVRKQIEDFTNDLNVEWESGNNKFTLGGYYSDFSSNDQWNLGNVHLLTAENNGRLLNLTLANGQIATNNGFTQGSFFNVNAAYDGREYAFYAVDEYQITPELRFDAGLRYQNYRATGTIENNSSVDTDNNPNTLYNNGTAVLNGTFRNIAYKKGAWSWTAGLNYDFSSSVGAYIRYNRGNTNPFFDNLRDGIFVSPRVDNYEGGIKVRTDLVSLYATLFHTKFSGLVTTVIQNGAPVADIGGARSTGIELEGQLRPVDNFTIAFSGTWLDAKYRNFFAGGGTIDLSGNRVQRQPKWQWRVTPSYDIEFGDSKVSLFSTFSYIGDRFSDTANTQSLPHYFKIDAGVSFDVNQALTFAVTADNLTDKVGLTEGDPRTLGQTGGEVVNARPILGRSFRFSAAYKF
ncbi:TonB-dependent receptor [Sphingopyxis sp. BSN-002]|uniref:TonB-dependent siderophore receptor n=1 Tax=Sphingopyxis sp. BSN-002 TaxID=2911495 RepID=UPI001EDB1DE1|nr:TonB-dependent receptor [Sphingopyxis sp. BSN-002]UKK85824.1 TonB-dependent receptor [Sphingopyxis sp. BSN-002]